MILSRVSPGKPPTLSVLDIAERFFKRATFFNGSGPVYAFVLEKDSAVNSWQELLGPNSPAVAKQTSPTR